MDVLEDRKMLIGGVPTVAWLEGGNVRPTGFLLMHACTHDESELEPASKV